MKLECDMLVFLDESDLRPIHQRFLDICNGAVVNPEITVMKDVTIKNQPKFGNAEKVTKIQRKSYL
jgi:hypothetical protein